MLNQDIEAKSVSESRLTFHGIESFRWCINARSKAPLYSNINVTLVRDGWVISIVNVGLVHLPRPILGVPDVTTIQCTNFTLSGISK